MRHANLPLRKRDGCGINLQGASLSPVDENEVALALRPRLDRPTFKEPANLQESDRFNLALQRRLP